ncbi:hypothetical protein BN903_57 [Halorubrum sp. AJ67]|nr:hypothetical protein BN903_57 [Halorubrum sp. AJ67]
MRGRRMFQTICCCWVNHSGLAEPSRNARHASRLNRIWGSKTAPHASPSVSGKAPKLTWRSVAPTNTARLPSATPASVESAYQRLAAARRSPSLSNSSAIGPTDPR